MAQDMKRSYRDTVISDVEFKVIVIGNPDVGKSSFIQRLVDNKFNSKKTPTYGMDKNNMMVLKGDTKINFAIWDTAGQQNYKHITSNFLNGCHGVFMVFDLTRVDSFLALDEWVKSVQEKAQPNTVIYLIGNKCDLPSESYQVQRPQIDRFMTMNKVSEYIEVSAKEGTRVKESFNQLSGKVILANPNSIVKRRFGGDSIVPGSLVDNKMLTKKGGKDNKAGGCC